MCAIFHGHWLRGEQLDGEDGEGEQSIQYYHFPHSSYQESPHHQLHPSFLVVPHCQEKESRAINRNVSEHLFADMEIFIVALLQVLVPK